jgi:hypothetical protein
VAEDWRLEQLKRHPLLRGKRFQRKPYRQRSAEWDHDHCAGCWAKFMATGKGSGDGAEPILYEGFATCSDYPLGAEYEWVCPECFDLFKDDMGWIEA